MRLYSILWLGFAFDTIDFDRFIVVFDRFFIARRGARIRDPGTIRAIEQDPVVVGPLLAVSASGRRFADVAIADQGADEIEHGTRRACGFLGDRLRLEPAIPIGVIGMVSDGDQYQLRPGRKLFAIKYPCNGLNAHG